MPFTTVNDARLFYDITGTGPPVVLVHGALDDHVSWSEVASGLANSFTVLTYDRRGHSRSDAPPGSRGIADSCADLIGLITTLELGPAHVVGQSGGGSIVLHTASRRPDLFQSLSVHEPPLVGLLADDPAFATVGQDLKEALGPVLELIERGEHREAVKLFIETVVLGPNSWDQIPEPPQAKWTRNAPTFFEEGQDPLALSLELDALESFPHPVLLTYSDQSPAFFPAVVAALAHALPQARTQELPGVGHAPQVTHPHDYSRMLAESLATVSA